MAEMEGVKVVDGKYQYEDKEGVAYEWDEQRQAWFPMWREDLINSQQSAYDVAPSENSQSTPASSSTNSEVPPSQSKKTKRPENEDRGTTVAYVTGLPLNTTIEDMKEFFSKCGIIKEDFETGLPKIKIYVDENGKQKGDGWVSFFRPESVQLAIDLLDQTEFKPGYKVSVTEGKFEMKADKKKRRVDKRLVKQKMNKMNKKFEWYEESKGVSSKFSKVVILKHMFTKEEIEQDPGCIIDIKQDIREECEKFGEVTSVLVFDTSDEGACSVKFKTDQAALACVEKLNGRWFAKRQIEAEIYDGKTKYSSKGTGENAEEEEAQRLENFAKWLESKGD